MPSTAPSFIDDGLSNIQPIAHTAPRVQSAHQQTKNKSHRTNDNHGQRQDASSKTKVSVWMEGATSDSESCIDDSCSFLCDLDRAEITDTSENTITAAAGVEKAQDWETRSHRSSCIDDGASTIFNFRSGRRAQQSSEPAKLKTVQEEAILDQKDDARKFSSVVAPLRRTTDTSRSAQELSANLRKALRDDMIGIFIQIERPISRVPLGKENRALRVQAPPDLATFVVKSKDGTTVLVDGSQTSAPVRRASTGQYGQRMDLSSAPIPFMTLQRHEVARNKTRNAAQEDEASPNEELSKQVRSSKVHSKKAAKQNKQKMAAPESATPAASRVPSKLSIELDHADSQTGPQSSGSPNLGLAALEGGDADKPISAMPPAISFTAPPLQLQGDHFMSGALVNHTSTGEHKNPASIPRDAFAPPFMPPIYPIRSPTVQGPTAPPSHPFPPFDPNYPPFGYLPLGYPFPPTGSGLPYLPPPPPPPPLGARPSGLYGSVPTPPASNYRPPTVESVRTSSASSLAGDGGYVALRRTIGATDGTGREDEGYCNATWGGIPVRVADWRVSSGAWEE